MPFMRLRRAVLTAALASSALLAACGGGDIVDQFTPSRGVLLDGGGNNWAQNVLNRYGSVPATSPAGTADFAVASTPVGAGLGTPSLAQRVDAALAAGLQEGDLVVLSAGVPDIVAEANGARSTAAMQAAGRAMADQVRRLVDGGAKHVLVANAYDLSKAPQFRGGPLERTAFELTRAFNDALKVALNGVSGRAVLLVDAEEYINRVFNSGGTSFGLTNVQAPACAGSTAGLGATSTGSCTTGSFGGDPAVFLFYDPLYVTPAAQALFGEHAFATIRNNW